SEESPRTMSSHGSHRHNADNRGIQEADASAQDVDVAGRTSRGGPADVEGCRRRRVHRAPVPQPETAQAAAPARAANTCVAGVVVQDADDVRALAAVCTAVKSAPDVREQRVAAIKIRVQRGTYAVPAGVLARTLLARATPSSDSRFTS